MQVGITQFNTNFEHLLKKMTCTTYLFAAPPKKEHAQSGVLQALCFTYECVGKGVLHCFVYQRNGLSGDAFFASFKSETFGGGGFDVDVVGAYVHDGCQFFSHGLDVW